MGCPGDDPVDSFPICSVTEEIQRNEQPSVEELIVGPHSHTTCADLNAKPVFVSADLNIFIKSTKKMAAHWTRKIKNHRRKIGNYLRTLSPYFFFTFFHFYGAGTPIFESTAKTTLVLEK